MFEITDDVSQFDKILSWIDSLDNVKYYKNVITITAEQVRLHHRDEIDALYIINSYQKVAKADLIILIREDGTEKVLKDRYRSF